MTVTDAVIDYVDWGICAICGMPHQTDIPKIWGRPTTCPVKRRPGVIGIRVFRICENCQHYDAAEVEAKRMVADLRQLEPELANVATAAQFDTKDWVIASLVQKTSECLTKNNERQSYLAKF